MKNMTPTAYSLKFLGDQMGDQFLSDLQGTYNQVVVEMNGGEGGIRTHVPSFGR
jgi:hypothetical protein